MPNFPCSNCGQHIEADISYVGTSVVCPACGNQTPVPYSGASTSTKASVLAKLTSQKAATVTALVIACLSLLLHFRIFTRVPLDFDTPESAIKTIVRLSRDGDFYDMKRAQDLLRDELSWQYTKPSELQIEKILEVKNTGDEDADGGALCFLKFKKKDGVDSHKVVLLSKNSGGKFNTGYISSDVKEQYGSVIRTWEKDGSLK